MTPAWLLWYGLHMGLTRNESLALPLGQLLDLIAVNQIKTEGAEPKRTQQEEEQDFFNLLNWR